MAVAFLVLAGTGITAAQGAGLREPALGAETVRARVERFVRHHGHDPSRYRLESCRYDYVTGDWTLLWVPPDDTFDDYLHVLMDRDGHITFIE